MEELTLEAPLVLPEHGGVAVQVVVGADRAAPRPVALHARATTRTPPWTRHATGHPRPRATRAAEPDRMAAAGRRAVDLDRLLRRARRGRPAIRPGVPGPQGRLAVRRRGLRRGRAARADAAEAGRFGLHPAALDAALHAVALSGVTGDQVTLPFALSRVNLHATGATGLRVRIDPPSQDGVVRCAVADDTGQPVASVDSLVLRPITAGQLAAAQAAFDDSLFQADWAPVAPAHTGSRRPYTALRIAAALRPARSHETAPMRSPYSRPGSLDWPDTRAARGRTHGAVSVLDGEDVTDLAGARVWGLVRTAQTENPGRFVLIDTDDADETPAIALGRGHRRTAGGHAQRALACRAVGPGTPTVPRHSHRRRPDGTVLITGAPARWAAWSPGTSSPSTASPSCC